MYKVLKRTCWAIVLPIRSFLFPCPRCRRRCGLLKVPNDVRKPGIFRDEHVRPEYCGSRTIRAKHRIQRCILRKLSNQSCWWITLNQFTKSGLHHGRAEEESLFIESGLLHRKLQLRKIMFTPSSWVGYWSIASYSQYYITFSSTAPDWTPRRWETLGESSFLLKSNFMIFIYHLKRSR